MKDKILTLIETELNILVDDYQKEITTLKNENAHLHKEIQSITTAKIEDSRTRTLSIEYFIFDLQGFSS